MEAQCQVCQKEDWTFSEQKWKANEYVMYSAKPFTRGTSFLISSSSVNPQL